MFLPPASAPQVARLLLAGIRILNGGLCLLAPAPATRGMGVDPEDNPAVGYVLRLFGIRTVLIGTELLGLRGADLDRSLRRGLLIHACDGAAAVAAGVAGRLSFRTAARATAISALNFTLAAAALKAGQAGGRVAPPAK